MTNIFGWSLPPGVSMSDIDPDEGPCLCCGNGIDDCICPECPVCSAFGDPTCYERHGLTYTEEQLAGQKAMRDAQAAEVEAMERAMPERDDPDLID